MEKKKISKINEFNILGIMIQAILTIVCLVVAIMCIFVDKKFLNLLQILVSIDLIVIGINNYLVYKKNKLTIVYLIFGFILLILGILSVIGVI